MGRSAEMWQEQQDEDNQQPDTLAEEQWSMSNYRPDPHRMAQIIAASSLKDCRANPNNQLGDWHDGRTTAIALMYYEPEILAAANEVRFLVGQYKWRHFA